jgi:5-formyltetrahydrofolate cyclo-ligase
VTRKSKAEIREEILKRLKGQDKRAKAEKDRRLNEKLSALPEFRKAKAVMFYVSLESEPDTKALIDEAIKAGKRVVVPVIEGNGLGLSEIKDRGAELAEGPCGILQPARDCVKPFPKEELDLVIVPGVAFGRDGARLGRGKGFYDRFLKDLPAGTKKVALAYDLQIIDDIPTTSRDIPVDIVITN